MADRIFVRDLLVRTIIGVNEHERLHRQDVLINVSLDTDIHAAAASDDVRDTVDYGALSRAIVDLVEASSYFLIEPLAEAIASLCLANPRVERATVRVEKPGAVHFASSVGVEIARDRPTNALRKA